MVLHSPASNWIESLLLNGFPLVARIDLPGCSWAIDSSDCDRAGPTAAASKRIDTMVKWNVFITGSLRLGAGS